MGMRNGDRQRQVVALFNTLPENQELDASEIARRLKMTRQTLASTLQGMVKRGVLTRRAQQGQHPAFQERRMHRGKQVLYKLATGTWKGQEYRL